MLKRDFFYDLLNKYKESTKKWEENKKRYIMDGYESLFYQSLEAAWPLLEDYEYYRDEKMGLKSIEWDENDNCFVISFVNKKEDCDSFIDVRILPNGLTLKNRKTYPNLDGIGGVLRDLVQTSDNNITVYRQFDNNSIEQATDSTNEFYASLKLSDKVKYLKSIQETEVLTIGSIANQFKTIKETENNKSFGL